MKKFIVLFFLLAAIPAFAQTAGVNQRQPREFDQAQQTKPLEGRDYANNTVVYPNIALTGNQATGNSGTIVLMATDSAGITRSYYLWVDATTTTGQLRMASFPNIKNYASFPWGDWRSSTGFTAGVKVSAQ